MERKKRTWLDDLTPAEIDRIIEKVKKENTKQGGGKMKKLTPQYIVDRMGKYDAEKLAHEILKLIAQMKQHSFEWTTQEERDVWGW